MNIGIEAQRLFRTKKHGMDIVALEMLRELQKIKSPHQYFVFVKADEDDRCLEESDQLKIVKLRGSNYVDFEQRQLPQAVKEYNIHLLHCTSNTAPLRLRIPLLITLHDIIYLERVSFKGTWYQNIGNLYRRYIVPPVVKASRKIITVSEYEKEKILHRLPQLEDKIQVVYNGISAKFRVYEDDIYLLAIKKPYGLPDHFIFFLGNQAPKKNMKNVLSAYALYRAKTPDAYPLVVAETNPEQLEAHLTDLGLQNLKEHIILTGYINHQHLPYIYNLADLFLYPSLRESFGIPILEAMACGTPVITSNTSAMPEVAGSAAYLVDPTQPESIAKAIQEILKSPQKAEKMRQAGLDRSTHFNWASNAQQTLEIYEELLSTKKSLQPG